MACAAVAVAMAYFAALRPAEIGHRDENGAVIAQWRGGQGNATTSSNRGKMLLSAVLGSDLGESAKVLS